MNTIIKNCIIQEVLPELKGKNIKIKEKNKNEDK